jgi:hypothetical protein
VGHGLRPTPRERSDAAPGVPRSLRTEWNVRDSDATLVVLPTTAHGTVARDDPGTAWTQRCAERQGRPLLVVDPDEERAARPAAPAGGRDASDRVGAAGLPRSAGGAVAAATRAPRDVPRRAGAGGVDARGDRAGGDAGGERPGREDSGCP